MATKAAASADQPKEGCCSSRDPAQVPDHLRTGNIFENRSCTDMCMILIYAIFFAGWIIVIAVATANGKPERILLPENFAGQLCGEAPLQDRNTYFAPLPSRPRYGFCTKKCPIIGDVVCNNVKEVEVGAASDSTPIHNTFYDHTRAEFIAGAALATKCKGSCTDDEQKKADRYVALRLKMDQKKCFLVFYPSKPNLQRCIPTLSTDGTGGETPNITLMAAINETSAGLSALKDVLGASSFFSLGFAEVKQAWLVILITAFICFGIAFVWVMLLRWILAPIVYTVVVLILGVFIGLGLIFMYLADDLQNNVLPGEKGTDNQVMVWRACEYLAFLCAAIYLVVMLFLMQRIRIAIAVMEEAGNAFVASPSMIVIPMVTFVILIGFVAFFVVTTIYIQTMGKFTTSEIVTVAQSYAGDSVNVSQLLAESKNSNLRNANEGDKAPVLNATTFTVEDSTKVLHAFNIFMILWTGNFLMMLGFMMMVFCVTAWYFSATQADMIAASTGSVEMVGTKEEKKGKEKGTDFGVMCSAFKATLFNHMGTVLWGALLIAIIQFVRAVFLYIQETYLKEWKESTTGAIALYCIQCCLDYIERVIKIISKNAFIICVIRNTGFCSSAAEALEMLFDHAATFSILAVLSNATIFIIKIFIVGCSVLAAFGLFKVPALTEDKALESGLFPLFIIFLMCFAIATLFLDVYEACIDTIFMCFCIDRKYFLPGSQAGPNGVAGGGYAPESLAKIIDVYDGAAKAQQRCDEAMKEAMKNMEAKKK